MVNDSLVVKEEFGAVEECPEDVSESVGVGGGGWCGFQEFEAGLAFFCAGAAAECGEEEGFKAIFVGHKREVDN